MKWRHQESKERREGGREEWSSSSFLNVAEEEEGEVKVEKVEEEELVSEVAADSTVDSALELVIPRH